MGGSGQRTLADLATARGFAIDVVRTVNATTEREVVAAAGEVCRIVERARAYVDESGRALAAFEGNERGTSLGSQLDRQDELVRGAVRDLDERATMQDRLARGAVVHTQTILGLAATIDQLTRIAKILALNARIEAARVAGAGAGFEVIAAEMQALANQVSAANDQVRGVASRLSDDLPALAAQSEAIHEAIAAFAVDATASSEAITRELARVRQEVRATLSAGNGAVEDILRASNESLSHLQFQDVVAQELLQIDGKLHAVEVGLVEELALGDGAAARIAPVAYATLGGAEHHEGPGAGEVTLF